MVDIERISEHLQSRLLAKWRDELNVVEAVRRPGRDLDPVAQALRGARADAVAFRHPVKGQPAASSDRTNKPFPISLRIRVPDGRYGYTLQAP